MAGINTCFLGSVFAFVSYGALLTAEATGQTRLATIPITAYVCAAAAAAVPISMLMAARGRRVGFLVGAFSGMLAALAIGIGAAHGSLLALVAGGIGIGVLTASCGYLRFAALEIGGDLGQGRCMTIVLSGGLVAAFAGPWLPTALMPALGDDLARAVAATLIAFNLAAGGLCFLIGFAARTSSAAVTHPSFLDSLRAVMGHAGLRQGITLCAGGYAVMTFLMNATPIVLTHHQDMLVNVTQSVMSLHFFAMFFPFLFSGLLLDRFGTRAMIWSGLAIYGATIGMLALASGPLIAAGFHLGLLLLGLGWNFLFIAGTAVIFHHAWSAVAHRSQQMTELITDTANALAAFSVGLVLHTLGWLGALAVIGLLTLLLALEILREARRVNASDLGP